MRTLAVLSLLAAVSLTGCSQDDAQDAVDQAKEAVSSAASDVDLPEVDWSKYGDKLQRQIDELADKADCKGLQEALDDQGSMDADVVAYIKAKLQDAGCS